MNTYDTLLFLHLLTAFALVAAMTTFWVLALATRPGRAKLTPQLAVEFARPSGIVIGLGTLGTLIFGIWLAIYLDGYELWDGWILASLILWLVSTAAGQQGGRFFQRAGDGGEGATADWRRGLWLLLASSLSVLVILILMIYKPGA